MSTLWYEMKVRLSYFVEAVDSDGSVHLILMAVMEIYARQS
jgi:hypothetical protein